MNTLFDEVELFEQTPTTFLKEIKPDEVVNIDSLTSHTEVKETLFTPQQPNGTAGVIPPSQPAQNMTVGSIVSSEMAAQLFNIILPAVMVIIIERATKKKVVKQQFEATNKEIEVIKPVLQNYLNSINFTVESPLNALVLTVAVIYGSKAIEALNGQAKGTIKTAEFTPPPSSNQPPKRKSNRPTGMKYNKTKN